MTRPNLLLCFDAFGTLFRVKQPIAQQYSEVARQCGLTGFSDDDVQFSFRKAFKDETKQHPNYGKTTGLGATRWWTNVIHKTFAPIIRGDQSIPSHLAPALLRRFSSSDGYEIEQNMVSSFRALKGLNQKRLFNKIVIGVVTNSDDRVPLILSSFGLNVSPVRHGTEIGTGAISQKLYDIDFHCMSYDVGAEKPDRLIFDAAELMLAKIISARDGRNADEAKAEAQSWDKVYVGDEYSKDVIGAMNASWNAILFEAYSYDAAIPNIKDDTAVNLEAMFQKSPVVGVDSIKDLVMWLTGDWEAKKDM